MTKDNAKQKILDLKDEIKELEKFIKKPEVKKEAKLDLFSITGYSELCKKTKTKELTIRDFSFLEENEQDKVFAFHQIKTIESVYNGDWIKDWTNRNQPKWYPWFNHMAHGGVALCGSLDYYYGSCGQVAYYKDKPTSDYVGRVYIEIYKRLM